MKKSFDYGDLLPNKRYITYACAKLFGDFDVISNLFKDSITEPIMMFVVHATS